MVQEHRPGRILENVSGTVFLIYAVHDVKTSVNSVQNTLF